YALELLGQEDAILAIDETCFPKRGQKSAGVGLQYCGTTGRVENCQVCVLSSRRSSESMMLLPVADGARLLGIHPKTLHHWLKEAHVPLATHPADARIKCVTEEHLQQVASLHGRPLQSSVPSQAQALCGPGKEREPASTGCS